MAQLAIDMGQDGPEYSLQGEKAYFDGCHPWCAGCKTLALFIYHPAIQHVLRLATTEVENESTCKITVFWELSN